MDKDTKEALIYRLNRILKHGNIEEVKELLKEIEKYGIVAPF